MAASDDAICRRNQYVDTGSPQSQPFTSAVAGDGLRVLARTAAERDLLVRFELSGFQRCVRTLQSYQHPLGKASAHLFVNSVAGLKLGVCEGAALVADGIDVAGWACDIAVSHRFNIFRLATATDGVLPNDRLEVPVSHGVSGQHMVTHVRTRTREVLPLVPDYQETLAVLGRHTRRNVRNARKLAAAGNIKFDFTEGASGLPDALVATLARRTDPVPVRTRRMALFEAYADRSGRPFRSTLRRADGTVISYCCGFLGQGAGYLLHQLNDRGAKQFGPSLMHRAFLIEALTQRACSELVFVHGCTGVLRHSCIPMIVDHYWVMRCTRAARLTAALLVTLQPRILLGRLAGVALRASRDPR